MKRALQFLAMAGLLLVIAFACQREENELLQNEKGISLQEAKQFFEQQETEKERNGIDFKITPKWETFMQDGENKDFVYIQAIINHQKERKAEIFFAKTKNGLKGTVIAEHYVDDNLTFLISDLEGNIASMCRIKNKESSLTARLRMFSDEDCPKDEGLCSGRIHCLPYECEIIGGKEVMKVPPCLTCMRKTIHLEEVTVYGTPVKRKISIPVYYVWFPQVTIPPMQDLYGINRFFEEKEEEKNRYDSYIDFRGDYVPPVKPDHIIDKLTDKKIKCLHDKLRNGNNDYLKEIFSEFEGKGTEFDIVISSVDNLINKNGRISNGQTIYDGSKAIKILINESVAKNNSSIDLARAILHEYIHADIFRKEKTKNINADINDFRKLYEDYLNLPVDNINHSHHHIMSLHYISIMKSALEKFHKEQLPYDYNTHIKHLNKETQNAFYTMLAWRGIKETNMSDYNRLSEKERESLKKAEVLLYFLGKDCK